MSQAVWTGSISFGLVNIPVKLYPATEPKDVRFHLYDRRTGKRVRYERVTKYEEPPTFEPEPSTMPTVDDRDEPRIGVDAGRAEFEPAVAAEPVDREDLVRGVELPTGELVTVTDDELYSIAPERSRTIDIEEFVDLAEIDPVFYEKSYHVAPARGRGAEKPYALLQRAMQGAGMVGIGIRPLKDALALETLFFGDEVRSPAQLVSGLEALAISDRELRTAKQLIAALATEWIPEKHADVYREELVELLRSKPATAPAEAIETTAAGEIGDLMSALRASVEAAKRKGAKRTGSKRAG